METSVSDPEMPPLLRGGDTVLHEVSTEGHGNPAAGDTVLAPQLLSTIGSVPREVIPVSQGEGGTPPWDMDSNPTPELSRTPTPEPIPSFTPQISYSAESLVSEGHVALASQSEDPIPVKQESVSQTEESLAKIKEEPDVKSEVVENQSSDPITSAPQSTEEVSTKKDSDAVQVKTEPEEKGDS